MEWNLATIISIAALCFSVISPIASAFITGYFRLKEKRLDLQAAAKQRTQTFYEEHRAQAIELYLQSAGQAIRSHGERDTFSQFGAHMGEIYFYVDPEHWPLIDTLEQALNDINYEYANQSLIQLSKALSGESVRTKE